jgi:hypothetical protein
LHLDTEVVIVIELAGAEAIIKPNILPQQLQTTLLLWS